jgi:hypothetical protein
MSDTGDMKDMEHRTDLVLLQARLARDSMSSMDADCRAFCQGSALKPHLRRVALSTAGSKVYIYLELPRQAEPGEIESLARSFEQHCPWAGDVRASRLEQVFDAPGASAGEAALFHYVVEMDPEEGWMPELARWYDTEHMPGLAAVPGCVRASRFFNHGHGPLSLACYDLVREETLGSAPWLAVRATAWSDIARPHFMNTLRTMFRIPAGGA